MDERGQPPLERVAPERIHVLHVDDDRDFAEMVGTLLEREDERITVTTRTEIERGLDRLREGGIDCVISDYDMPDGTGIELIEQVREYDRELPVILFTGKGSEAVAGEAISAGVTDYLQKGNGSEQYTVLANRIRNAVSRYRAERRVGRGFKAIEAAQEGIGLVGTDGEFAYVNPAFAETFGYDREELVGSHWERLYDESEIRSITDSALPAEGEGRWTGELSGTRKDGVTVSGEHTVTRAADGALIFTISGLSEQHRQLRSRRSQLGVIVDNLPLVLFALDEEGRFTLLDGEGLSSLDPEPGELVGQSVFEVLDGNPELLAHARAVLEGEPVHAVERVGERALELWCEPVPHTPGEDSAIGVAVDVTERRERERRIEGLHESTRRLMGAASRQEIAERAVETASDLLGMPLSSVFFFDAETDRLVPAAAADRVPEVISELPRLPVDGSLSGTVFQEKTVRTFEDVSAHPDRYNPETSIRGQIILPLGKYGVMHLSSTERGAFDQVDVSLARILAANTEEALARVEREEDVRATNRQLQAVLDTVEARIFMKETEGRYRVFNDMARELMGIDEDTQVLGRTVHDFLEEEAAEMAAASDRRVIETGEQLRTEEEIPLPGGTRTFLTIKSPMFDEDGEVVGICCVSTDITERKRREQELEALRTRMELALAGTDSVVWERDLEEESFTRHGPVDQVYGHVENGAGETIEEFYEMVCPEDRDRVREAMERAIAEGSSYRTEYRVVGEEGRRWFRTRGEVQTENGEPTRVVGLATDITEYKRYERELERQNERLEEFSGVVSHDLRNPLSVARARLELAAEECESEHLEAVAGAHDRMETLIDNILQLARESESVTDPDPVELATVAEESWETVATGWARLAAGVDRTIRADAARVRQLFENLYRNAVEHAGEDVTVTVGELDGGFYVADDGPGIPPEDRERVFESGYSTADEGTGFGLAIVRQIVNAHGWEIAVTESSDGGARFEITGVEFVDG